MTMISALTLSLGGCMSNTVDTLLTSVKTRSMIPISQNTFNDTKLLILMTEELRSYVVPEVISVREDYFLTYKDLPIEANRELYPLVERAIGNSFKALSLILGSDETQMQRTDVKASYRFRTAGSPGYFFLMGDSIRVLPTPTDSTGSLRQYYFRAQSELVKVSSCAKITGFTKGATTTVFDVDTDVSGDITTSDQVDFQGAKSPHLIYAFDVDVSGISATQITVSNDQIEDSSGELRMGIGDYITPRFKTCVPQIPVEYHTLLVQKVVLKLYESLNDMKKYQLAMADLKQMEKNLFGLIKNRIESQPRKIRNSGILESIGRY